MAGKPWPPREPSREPNPAHQLRSPVTTWPAEPEVLRADRRGEFTAALAYLCSAKPDAPTTVSLGPKSSPRRRQRRQRSVHAGGARAHFASRLQTRLQGEEGRDYGLFGIEPGMYRVAGAPAPPVDKNDLTSRSGCWIRGQPGGRRDAAGDVERQPQGDATPVSAAARTGAASRTSSGAIRCDPAGTRI